MGICFHLRPFTVVPSVCRGAGTAVPRAQVVTGAPVKAGTVRTLVYVQTLTPHHLSPRTTAGEGRNGGGTGEKGRESGWVDKRQVGVIKNGKEKRGDSRVGEIRERSDC